MRERFFEGLLLFVGTIIGVGFFALPYVISRVGFFWGMFEMIIIGSAVLIIHLMYAETALSVEARHQLPGYARIYLGRAWGRVTTYSSLLGLLGALIAYIALGSNFLGGLISPVVGENAVFIASFFYLFLGLVVFFRDSLFASRVDGILASLLLLLLGGFVIFGISRGTFEFLSYSNISDLALPYGVILFSLTGASVIPRVKEVLRREERLLSRVIIIGTLLPALLYAGFVFAILASSSAGVSRDAISGVLNVLGPTAVFWGRLIGTLSTLTAYIGIGLSLKAMLQYDAKLPKSAAWIFVSTVPFLLVLLGFSNFVAIVSLVGAVIIGFESVVLTRIWRRLPRHSILKNMPTWATYILTILFSLGVVYEFVVFFG